MRETFFGIFWGITCKSIFQVKCVNTSQLSFEEDSDSLPLESGKTQIQIRTFAGLGFQPKKSHLDEEFVVSLPEGCVFDLIP